MKVHKGDTVLVIAGKDKGAKGKVIEAYPTRNKVLVEGVNRIKKHTAQSQNERGASSAAVAVVGSPSTPSGLTAAMPPRRNAGSSSGSGAVLPTTLSSTQTSAGERCSSTDVSVWPAWASAPAATHGHQATSRPSARSSVVAAVSAATLPP